MKFEEAKAAQAELQKEREIYINKEVKKEENAWSEGYRKDKHFVEKKLIKEIIGECKMIPHFGSEISSRPICLHLDKTAFSGDRFLNKKQLTDVMKRAGFDVQIERKDWEGTYLKVEINYKDISKSNIGLKSIELDDAKLESLISKGEQDWLIDNISFYISYLLTDRGRVATEDNLTLSCYNKITDEWYKKIMLDYDGEPYCDEELYTNNVPVSIPGVHLNKEFGDIENVLAKLKDLLSVSGFEMKVIYNEDNNSKYNIEIKEKNFILDETGLVKNYRPKK